MKHQEYLGKLLSDLLQGGENEVIEFKRDICNNKEIGKYFSAIANEANLHEVEKGWLICGIDNDTHDIIGVKDFSTIGQFENLKKSISDGIEPSMTFLNIHALNTEKGKVIFFEIPQAPKGIPIAWGGHYYGRVGDSLVALTLDKLDRIRHQVTFDWTAQIVEGATLEHLDPTALEVARIVFVGKYANRFKADEVMGWSETAFLDRIKITIDGKITRAAILLLGKRESVHLLSPSLVQMTWKLEGAERAYQHFGPPFLLTTTELYQKIRNVQIRIFPEDQLLGIELAKYDQKIVLEALHNCIAHQDYSRNARVIVTELPDRLLFENEGIFFGSMKKRVGNL